MLKLRVLIRHSWMQSSKNYATASAPSIDKTKQTVNGNEKKVAQPGSTGLVAAAFAALQQESVDAKPSQPTVTQKINTNKQNNMNIEQIITNASNVNTLLMAAEVNILPRKLALKIISKLSEWSSTNKIQISDFSSDPRFLKVCRILGRNRQGNVFSNMTHTDDLGTVLSITGEDEAARIIADLTVPQIIKVMSALVRKGSRSTPILQAISYNIGKHEEMLNLKQCADMLYSMTSLNFPDPVLMEKISNDIRETLTEYDDKSSVVFSIIRSIGGLRYKDVELLKSLCHWMCCHGELCTSEDVACALITFSTLNWKPEGATTFYKMVANLKEEELSKCSTWLNVVYSLVILDKVTEQHLSSVMSKQFIEKLYTFYKYELPILVKRKLVNLDAYTTLAFPHYDGPRLPSDIGQELPIVYTKEKQFYVQSILDTLKSLVSSDKFMKRQCDPSMGFLYDSEFVLDSNCHPVPLEKAESDKRLFRIAIMGLDYHDFCRKTIDPLGHNDLYRRMLQLKGFHVLTIPYNEYNPRDKLITRVQYIEKRLKDIVNKK